VRQAKRNPGKRPGSTTGALGRIKTLERVSREQLQANETLR
jgi:hypothetical protein